MYRGISLLLLATLFSGCMKHENLFDEDKAKEEAEKNFPVQNIDPNQDWVMAVSRTLDVTVNEKTGETYIVKVFDAYPFDTEKDVRLLAKTEVKDGSTASVKFDAPLVLERIYVMRQLGESYVIRVSDIENERFGVVFGTVEGRSVGARNMPQFPDTSKYTEFDKKKATRITDGSQLKDLEKGIWYIDSEIESKDGISLDSGACLYIEKGGHLKAGGTLKVRGVNSYISVLEEGLLTIDGDFTLGNESSDKSTVFYNGGTVEADDVDLEKKCLFINKGSFTAKDFEVKGEAEVWNRCRLIITDDDDDVFAMEKGATFNNEGYVHVVKGGAKWEKCVINLAGNAVFEIADELEINDEVTLSAIGETTLIAAHKVDFDDDDDISLSGTINVSCSKMEDNPGNVNLVEVTITDTGDCTVKHKLNEVPEHAPSVTTYGFEDTVSGATDYDFNDVVLHVSNLIDNKIKVTLVAAGATNAITAQYSLNNGVNYTDMSFNGESEVHAAFGKPITEMINTNHSITIPDSNFPSYEIENVPDGFSFATNGRICIKVDDTIIESHNKIGGVPYALSVPIAWAYPAERVRIDVMYEKFGGWGENMDENKDWYMFKTE